MGLVNHMSETRKRSDIVVVTGAAGRLGSALLEKNPRFVPIFHQECDICSPEEIETMFAKYKPDTVVHCASITDMSFCEENPGVCTKVNVGGTAHVSDACKKYGAQLIHISSDAINDPGAYGRSKQEAEKVAQGIIVRVNFFTEDSYLVKMLLNNEPVKAYTNMFFNPISLYSFVDELSAIIAPCDSGFRYETINIGTKEKITPYDFSMGICEVFGLTKSLVTPEIVNLGALSVPRSENSYINPANTLSLADDMRRIKDEFER